MTKTAVAHTGAADASEAGAELSRQVQDALGGESPDALILFASARYDFPALLAAIEAGCRPAALVGASSAGEFTTEASGVGMACAVALRAPDMLFSATSATGLAGDRNAVARELSRGFRGVSRPEYKHRAALVLSDAFAGYAEEFVEMLTALTGGSYRLFGGGAGGDDRFERRFVFHGARAIADGAVALEILSNKPIGVGVRHGWRPAGDALRVTEAKGPRLASLNAIAAAEVFEEYAECTRQRFDRKETLPFFLHNVLGVESGSGHKLRVPIAVNEDGSVQLVTEVPEGATCRVMNVTTANAVAAAAESTRDAVGQLGGHAPAVALFFDCVATRLRMGKDFGFELGAVREQLGGAPFAGCNSIGQIARVDGQFSGFHNCTAVVCVIPQ